MKKKVTHADLHYMERKMIVADYCGHKFKYWLYKRKYDKIKKRLNKEGLYG